MDPATNLAKHRERNIACRLYSVSELVLNDPSFPACCVPHPHLPPITYTLHHSIEGNAGKVRLPEQGQGTGPGRSVPGAGHNRGGAPNPLAGEQCEDKRL